MITAQKYNATLANIISGLSLDDTYRGECPQCRRSGTFTVTRMRDAIVYNCYSAGCALGGRQRPTHLTPEDIRASHNKSNKERPNNVSFDTSRFGSNGILGRVLDKYDINYPDIPIMYDAKEQRVVFLLEGERGQYVDGIGRATNKYRAPKWKRYCGDSNLPVVVPFHRHTLGAVDTLYIVEDIISAWKLVKSLALKGCQAMALLGTSLSDRQLRTAWQYDKIVICLDKDATNKSIALSRRISMGVKSCSITMLDKDIKDMTVEEIQLCWT